MSETSPPNLNAIELRVLGVLMEKQLTTPEQYPLTLNSVITACNQKSSRDPITQYNQGEVSRALNELDTKHFIRRERGSRAEKFEQHLMNELNLGRKQQALLCVMMLRGPQTISELSTRTQRMCDFIDREELELCIERLCSREVPYTIRLSHQAGQRGERITHLFSGEPLEKTPEPKESAATQTASVPTNEADMAKRTRADATHSASQDSENVSELRAQVDELHTMVKSLQQESSTLKEQLERLYALSGQNITTHAE